MRGLFEILAALSSIVTRRDSISTYPNAVDPAAVPGAQTNETSAPFYPSPWMTGTGDWAEAYQKARDFVSQLTLLEKVNLTTGVGYVFSLIVVQTRLLAPLSFRLILAVT